MWRILLIFIAAFAGFWRAQDIPFQKKRRISHVHPEKKYPLTEHKAFTIVLYAYNQAQWCERSLASIFEQDYDHYRIIFIDDHSTDGTTEKAKQYIVENNQDEKVILIRNERKLGPVASLYRAIDSCQDREIIFPLEAKDWLAHPDALNRLNGAYQNPDVWLTFESGLEYPTYHMQLDAHHTFYAALFKQIHLSDFYKEGNFTPVKEAYLKPLIQLSGGRLRHRNEPIAFSNLASPTQIEECATDVGQYDPLTQFPVAQPQNEKADILIFSYDRPLQLYACLESIQRYITGFEKLTVLYRASTPQFKEGYLQVQNAFPHFDFVAQSSDPKHDFKPNVLKIVFDSPSKFILFGVDDIIVKDFADLNVCMEQMQKTDAYGFYLRFGRHINYCYQSNQPQPLPPSLPLNRNIYAWDIQTGSGDWGFPNSVDMTLFRKEQLKKAFHRMKFKTPNSLEFIWASEYKPKKAIGLYFEHSKLVNVPMNVVSRTGNPHMNYLNTDELLAKFNQGLKIDIEPLHKMENPSPHLSYIPEFVLR